MRDHRSTPGSADLAASPPDRPLNWPLNRRLLLASACALAACSREPLPAATAPAAAAVQGDASTVKVAAMLLPGLVDSAERGALIRLLQALDEAYTEGSFLISTAPVGHVYASVSQGLADFGLPSVRLPGFAREGAPFRLSTTAFGTVSFVLYSRPDRVISRRGIEDELKSRRPFQLHIEAPGLPWGFPVEPFSDFESAFRKVAAGRIDAFLWAQEEADLSLRALGLRGIRRELYAALDDVFILPPTPRGEAVDSLLTRLVGQLRASGQLAALYRDIHRAFDPWQPEPGN